MDSLKPGAEIPLRAGEKGAIRKGQPSIEKCMAFYKKSCEEENAEGCFRHGSAYLTGIDGHVEVLKHFKVVNKTEFFFIH
jgi:TPR repeat protein